MKRVADENRNAGLTLLQLLVDEIPVRLQLARRIAE
jgi:hypothetical protein